MIVVLHKDDTGFPDVSCSEPDGLLAVGGDLGTERLLAAYRLGIFPWYSEQEPICWYAPIERCVIFPGELIISRSMKKILSRNVFEIKKDTAFVEVIRSCSHIKRKDQHGTWITKDMMEAYIRLHRLGVAHSFEAWQGDQLVGGMYGLEINKVFCGESMFSMVSNASKAVLISLCRSGSYDLLDCQLPNDHLMSLGARMISREEFKRFLQQE